MIKNGKLVCPEVRIEVTNKCNAKCVMCPRDTMTRPLTTMKSDLFKRLVDEAKTLGAQTISPFGYGEPLLDKGIVEKVAYCTESGLETFITTNASILDTDLACRLIKAGLKNIRFSVHGLLKDQYERVHVGLKWDTMIRNIMNFVVMNRKRFNSSCNVHLTAMPMSGEDIEKIKDFWLKDVDFLEIWKPHNWAGTKHYRAIHSRRKTCGRPFSGPVQINADGTMMICCFDYDSKMTIGNVSNSTIKEVLTSSFELKRIQSLHRQGVHEGLPCLTCDQLNIGDKPLLYSNRDHDMAIYKTSTTKFKLGGQENDSNSELQAESENPGRTVSVAGLYS